MLIYILYMNVSSSWFRSYAPLALIKYKVGSLLLLDTAHTLMHQFNHYCISKKTEISENFRINVDEPASTSRIGRMRQVSLVSVHSKLLRKASTLKNG